MSIPSVVFITILATFVCIAGMAFYLKSWIETILLKMAQKSSQDQQLERDIDVSEIKLAIEPVSYTHLTLPTKRIV